MSWFSGGGPSGVPGREDGTVLKPTCARFASVGPEAICDCLGGTTNEATPRVSVPVTIAEIASVMRGRVVTNQLFIRFDTPLPTAVAAAFGSVWHGVWEMESAEECVSEMGSEVESAARSAWEKE